MTTSRSRVPGDTRFTLALTMLAAVAIAACSAGSSASTPAPSQTPAPSHEAPIVDGGPGLGGGDAIVVPKPGQLDVHPISADSFTAHVSGRRVVVTIAYTSGIEPCSVLDAIVVERGRNSFAITLRQGRGPGDQVCIMIARFMKTQVDLGDLAPGTYTISDATGGASAIQVVVS